MVDEFKAYLNKVGLKYDQKPNVEFLTFNTNNLNYMFQWQSNDPAYFRLSLPTVDNEVTEEVRRIAMDLNAQYKVAKVIELSDNNVWIIAESFVYSYDNVDALFSRLILLLGLVVEEYRKRKGGAL